MKRFILLTVLTLAFCTGLPAQTFSLITGREPVASLDGLWRFHTGDNPAWASPNFDDSGWALIRGNRSWSEQGYAKLNEFAWYRARIEIPAEQSDVALYIPRIVTSYEVYADGSLLGGEGGMPPHAFPVSEFLPAVVYKLPAIVKNAPRTVTVAIRVWHSPLWESLIGGGLYEAPLIGQTELMERRKADRMDGLALSKASEAVLAALEALAGLAALGFFWVRPREKEYLWFLVWMFASAGLQVATRAVHLDGMDVRIFDTIQILLQTTFLYAQIAFFYRLLSGRRGWLFWAAIGSVAGRLVIALTLLTGSAAGVHLPQGTLAGWNLADVLLSFAPAIWVLTLLFQRTLQGLLDARLLLAPVLLLQFSAIMNPIIWLELFIFGWSLQSQSWYSALTSSPFNVSVPDACEGLFLIGMLAIFVGRFTRTSQQEDAHRRELAASRAVQQVLIPEQTPAVPGFQIESVYKPYGEVGGDFFQILPRPDGSVLIAIGDVSGKGMPAAMMVSLLVGALSALAETTTSPAQLLAGLNRRILGRNHGGFTTCLILHASPSGTCTAANAGHIPPYLNGNELACENNLPLGLVAETSYCEFTFQTRDSDRLTLLTDGVVEASSGEREIFGFARAEQIIHQPAAAIADAAQRWGQEDDITVLTVARIAPAMA